MMAAAKLIGSFCVTGLCGFLVFWLVMRASCRILAVIAQLRQLLVVTLDRGFLLPQDFLDQFVAFAFDGFLLGEEFIDVIFRHGFCIVLRWKTSNEFFSIRRAVRRFGVLGGSQVVKRHT